MRGSRVGLTRGSRRGGEAMTAKQGMRVLNGRREDPGDGLGPVYVALWKQEWKQFIRSRRKVIATRLSLRVIRGGKER